MILRQQTRLLAFRKSDSLFAFLPSGDISEFRAGHYMLNEFRGSPCGGSANNIWLRIYGGGKPRFYPMLGIRSQSRLSRGKSSLAFEGTVEKVAYRVTFCAADARLWFWKVDLQGNGETVDVVYGQDIGVAEEGALLANELYTAQYLGHCVRRGPHGFVVCSRQNMAQGQPGEHPYLQQGMAQGRALGYSTDGSQFFGLSYRATGMPAALAGDLQNRNDQFEYSFTALQSEKLILTQPETVAFYGLFRPDHEKAVTDLEFTGEVAEAYRSCCGSILQEKREAVPSPRRADAFTAPYVSPQWDAAAVARHFPQRKLEERDENGLLSFFTPAHTHVVLQRKELTAERPHGHIVNSRMNLHAVDSNILSSTNYMAGLFNAQTVVGNTSFHKLFSTARGLLYNLNYTGQRLYVKLADGYRLLTLPAAYEMGVFFSRWFYELPGDLLTITAFAAADRPDVVLDVRSGAGREYPFLLTQELVMGEHEFLQPVELEELTGTAGEPFLRIRPDVQKRRESPYPALHYDLHFSGASFALSDDRIFFDDGLPRDGTLLTVRMQPCAGFRCLVQGRLSEEPLSPVPNYAFEREAGKFDSFYRELTCGFQLDKEGNGTLDAEALNETVIWFSHNAMTHYAMPHGLEQTGGAAWGTRDVCQGPAEYFLAMHHGDIARATLLEIFGHQQFRSREWPQWFMFDRYTDHAGDCHGDVVLWPLKALGDYLEEFGDDALLEHAVPYRDDLSGEIVPGSEESLLRHVKRAVLTLYKRFLPGTDLISYAGGDWDDTLQPADPAMRDRLVSSWTQALAFQVTALLGRALQLAAPAFARRLACLSQRLEKGFDAHLVPGGVIAGFVYRQDDGGFAPLLHPQDDETGIHYRLLPMTRSIISSLADPSLADRNVRLIDAHLSFPDGVRTMDRPARYEGGVSRLFLRAEQAANVGREISLQYTHAHIRYLEAMAKLGEGGRVWKALLQVSPVCVGQVVPNAAPRQRNMYFSSSDGLFPDRYAYSRDFEKLREGSVPVRGGWRLYSSGPGIYLRQLVSNVLGIRFGPDALILDPVLPAKMDGLRFTFRCFGRETVFVYHVAAQRSGLLRAERGGAALKSVPLPNIYRQGGLCLSREEFLGGEGEIHIFLH